MVDSSNWEGLKSPVKGGVIFPSTANDRTFKNSKSERNDFNSSKTQFSRRDNIFVNTTNMARKQDRLCGP